MLGIKDLPISNYAKEFYTKSGVTLTDFEIAALLWDYEFCRKKLLRNLREIADETKDDVLKSQIEERLTFENRLTELFKDNSSGNFVFVIAASDNDEWKSGYFKSFEAAVKYGMAQVKDENGRHHSFKIEKEPLLDLYNDSFTGYRSCVCEPDGNISNLLYDEIEDTLYHQKGRFERHYVYLDNPFEKGDIVRWMGDGEVAVVESSKAKWHEHFERFPLEECPDHNDHDHSLRVEILYHDGEISHGHPSFLLLEKVTEWEDNAEWELLNTMSHLICGKGGIDDFLFTYYRNLHLKENNN